MNRRELLLSAMASGALYSNRAFGQLLPAQAGLKSGTAVRENLAIVNGNVWTMDSQRPRAQAVLIRDGRIALVGSNSEVKGAAAGAKVMDAGGASVLPGFIDSHTHMELSCYTFAGLEVDIHTPPLKSLEEIYARLREKCAKTKPGNWVVGRGSFGFDQQVTEKRMPSREDLDRVSTAHPIIAMAGLHCWSMNTLGFNRLGIWDAASEGRLRWRDGRKRLGSDVARDAEGKPTGVLTETFDILPNEIHTFDEKVEAVRTQVIPGFVSKGITSTCSIPVLDDDFRVSQYLHAQGALPIRMRTYPVIPFTAGLDEILHNGMISGFGDEMMSFGGVKLFVAGAGYDASLKRMTDMHWSVEDLEETVLRAHNAGLHILLHQAGASLPATLQAVEKAQARSPRPLRHRLEHYGSLTDEQMVRVKKLGMGVCITAPNSRSSGAENNRRGSRYRAMIEAGLMPVSVSDSTGTIPEFSPLTGIAALVSSVKDGGSSPEGQAPSLEEAIRMWTIWAAQSVHEEDIKGSLTVGKFGDVAILDRNIERAGVDLFDVKVRSTVLGGRVVHQA